MKLYRLIFAFNSILLTEVGIVAGQKEMTPNDHLTCFKIKDEHKVKNVIVNMDANEAQKEFSVENCVVAKKATRMCIPSTKKVLTAGVADPTLGGLVDAYDPRRCVQNDLLCYKVTKCTPNKPPKPRLVIDQFNRKGEERKVRFKKNGMEICTPAWKLTPTGELVVVDCGPPVALSAAPSVAPSAERSQTPTVCVDDPTFVFNIPGMIEFFKCADLIFPGLKEMACALPYIALACCESCNASEAPTVSPTVSPTVCADDPAYRFYVFCQVGSPFCQEFGCADILTFPGLRDKACASANVALACCESCNAPTQAPAVSTSASPSVASSVTLPDRKCEFGGNQYPNLFNASFLPFKPTLNNIIDTISQPPFDYRLTFGLTVHSLQPSGDQSVIRFTTGNDLGGYGTRVPGVWLRNVGQGPKLLVEWHGTLPLNFMLSPELEFDKEYCFTLTAKDLTLSQGTQLQIIMDGSTVNQGVSQLPRSSLQSVKVYAGDPWYLPADVTISDLYFAQY